MPAAPMATNNKPSSAEKRKLPTNGSTMTTELQHEASKRAKTETAAPVASGLWVQRTVAIGQKDKPAARDSPATNGLWVKQSIAFAF
ncbi:hypothetical protein SDRG_03307 [Saprolegnia diclina VS20]|uniref:Uncharacterized protein n=1 Tax=Saprolegnia diclina (strain VS20) TaxID=1156394 RepID=T0QM05_SAPDV|nr:hypothetical protein SDRG_03307 [Saprolegnia diclina VS20]EQC39099.1 hypothetical protein SDRG_03307 [Saprolegnia diclina VS20]|eukprot:XP_008607160.1 hypothetical protein SDRG_03307 [Saprolegnia diclina VS20]